MPSERHLNNYVSKSDAYTVSQIADQVLAASAAMTFTLPAASACFPGQTFEFINAITAGGTVTIAPAGSDTINGTAASVALIGLYQRYKLISDGSAAWFLLRSETPIGYINLSIASLREVASDLIVNIATSAGGHLGADTTPTLTRINAATDKSLVVTWAANGVDEVQFAPVVYPPDLDDGRPITIYLRMAKDTNTNTTTNVKVSAFEGIGDTDFGTSTAAMAVSTLATYSVALAASDVGAAPAVLNLSLIPAAHANDAIKLYGAYLAYFKR